MTGSIIRADNSGLGTLSREFYDNGIIQKVLIFPNGVYESFPKRFPNSRTTNNINNDDIEWLFDGIDKLIFFETPFRWDILNKAKEKNIRTIIIPMHEGLPDTIPSQPDMWVCPSSLEYEIVSQRKTRLNIPVNTKRIKWKLRKTAKIFVHNAGHGGIDDRNGTSELLEAMKFVKSPIRLIIRSQNRRFDIKDNRIKFEYANIKNYWDIWKEGDVFIFPEKFNGLSLPIQEAIASGMAIMSTNRRPFNEWLPPKLLIPATFRKKQISREIECAVIKPEDIAKKIDEWYNKDIRFYSFWGKEWGKWNSWNKLRLKYKTL